MTPRELAPFLAASVAMQLVPADACGWESLLHKDVEVGSRGAPQKYRVAPAATPLRRKHADSQQHRTVAMAQSAP